MIVSITGATGFIGSHLVDRLLERGYTVRAMTRKTSNLRWLKDKPVELVEGDLRSVECLENVVRDADYVYHIAGVVKARKPEEYFEGNETATRNLMEACRRAAPDCKRFLFVSSQTAGGPASLLEKPITEKDESNPITTYGRSKLAAENVVREYTGVIPWTIVRPPAVFGPRDTEIYIYFKTLAKGLNSIIGFDDKRLSLIYCDDLVEGIMLAAESPAALGQLYFISSEEYYSWPQVGGITSRLLGRKIATVRIPHFLLYTIAGIAQCVAAIGGKPATLNLEKAKDFSRRYWICDTEKAMKELGYRQKTNIEEAVRKTLEWYKLQGWL